MEDSLTDWEQYMWNMEQLEKNLEGYPSIVGLGTWSQEDLARSPGRQKSSQRWWPWSAVHLSTPPPQGTEGSLYVRNSWPQPEFLKADDVLIMEQLIFLPGGPCDKWFILSRPCPRHHLSGPHNQFPRHPLPSQFSSLFQAWTVQSQSCQGGRGWPPRWRGSPVGAAWLHHGF